MEVGRTTPDASDADPLDTGERSAAQAFHQQQQAHHQQGSVSRDPANSPIDKLSASDVSENSNKCVSDLTDIFSQNYFKYEQGNCAISVVGRLKSHVSFWNSISANQEVLDIIQRGYVIPLITVPKPVFLKNNLSARKQPKFVAEAILDLVKCNSVFEVFDPPTVINPLTVAFNKKGKLRLVLDMRHVNKDVWKEHCKFEDMSVLLQYLKSNAFAISFDLKSGYHHISIVEEQHQFLGFAWDFGDGTRFFCFRVLPFGLSTAGHVFTKVVRVLVKHWRSHALKLVVFLDDGICTNEDKHVLSLQSKQIKSDLIASGFVPNVDKCIWIPVQSIVWLGHLLKFQEGLIVIPAEKV
jgi:hypothetical protein